MDKLVNDLSKIAKRLERTHGNTKDKSKVNGPLSLEPEVRDILITLSDTISALVSVSADNVNMVKTVDVLSTKVRLLEDSNEHLHQRSLRGKFFVTFPKGESPTSEKVLKDQGSDVMAYTCKLITSKYGVPIEPNHCKTCHHTRTGLVFRLICLWIPLRQTCPSNQTRWRQTNHNTLCEFQPYTSSLLTPIWIEKHEEKQKTRALLHRCRWYPLLRPQSRWPQVKMHFHERQIWGLLSSRNNVCQWASSDLSWPRDPWWTGLSWCWWWDQKPWSQTKAIQLQLTTPQQLV